MPIPPRTFSIPLESTPGCSSRIGVLFGLFALIEIHLFQIFARFSNSSIDVAAITLNSHVSFERRIQLLGKVYEANPTPSSLNSEEMGDLRKALQMANMLRNRYAHSTYAVGTSPESLTLVTPLLMNPTKPKFEKVNLANLDKDVLFFKRLIVFIEDYNFGKIEAEWKTGRRLRQLAQMSPLS